MVWKVYGRKPHEGMALLQAMEEACGDIPAESCHGWMCHARRYFPHCLAMENIACDVDENLWWDQTTVLVSCLMIVILLYFYSFFIYSETIDLTYCTVQ